jgi:riboflavin biosynthesis pyrimidine reductase
MRLDETILYIQDTILGTEATQSVNIPGINLMALLKIRNTMVEVSNLKHSLGYFI